MYFEMMMIDDDNDDATYTHHLKACSSWKNFMRAPGKPGSVHVLTIFFLQ